MKNKGIMSIAPRTSASLQAVPRETVIRGQPHRLAYINPVEEQALLDMGGSGAPVGPGGVPAFFLDFSDAMTDADLGGYSGADVYGGYYDNNDPDYIDDRGVSHGSAEDMRAANYSYQQESVQKLREEVAAVEEAKQYGITTARPSTVTSSRISGKYAYVTVDGKEIKSPKFQKLSSRENWIKDETNKRSQELETWNTELEAARQAEIARQVEAEAEAAEAARRAAEEAAAIESARRAVEAEQARQAAEAKSSLTQPLPALDLPEFPDIDLSAGTTLTPAGGGFDDSYEGFSDLGGSYGQAPGPGGAAPDGFDYDYQDATFAVKNDAGDTLGYVTYDSSGTPHGGRTPSEAYSNAVGADTESSLTQPLPALDLPEFPAVDLRGGTVRMGDTMTEDMVRIVGGDAMVGDPVLPSDIPLLAAAGYNAIYDEEGDVPGLGVPLETVAPPLSSESSESSESSKIEDAGDLGLPLEYAGLVDLGPGNDDFGRGIAAGVVGTLGSILAAPTILDKDAARRNVERYSERISNLSVELEDARRAFRDAGGYEALDMAVSGVPGEGLTLDQQQLYDLVKTAENLMTAYTERHAEEQRALNVPVDEGYWYQLSKGVQNSAKDIIAGAEDVDSKAFMYGSAVGSGLAFLAAVVPATVLGSPAAGTAIASALGSAANATGLYDEAYAGLIKQGKSPGEAQQIALEVVPRAMLIGATEGVTFARATSLMPPQFRNALFEYAADIPTEVAQEVFVTVVNDLVQKDVWDPERNVFKGAGEAAELAAVATALISAGVRLPTAAIRSAAVDAGIDETTADMLATTEGRIASNMLTREDVAALADQFGGIAPIADKVAELSNGSLTTEQARTSLNGVAAPRTAWESVVVEDYLADGALSVENARALEDQFGVSPKQIDDYFQIVSSEGSVYNSEAATPFREEIVSLREERDAARDDAATADRDVARLERELDEAQNDVTVSDQVVAQIGGELVEARALAYTLQSSLDQSQQALSEKVAAFDAQTAELGLAQTELSRLQTENESLLGDLSSAQGDLQTEQTRANDLQTQLQTEQGRVGALESDVSAANERVSGLENDIATKNAELAEIQGSLDSVTAELEEARTNLSRSDETLLERQERISALEQSQADLEADLANAQRELESVQGTLTEVTTARDELQTQYDAAQSTIGQLEADLSAANENVSQLDTLVADLTAERDNFQADLALLESVSQQQADDLATRTADLATRTAELDALRTEYDSFRTQTEADISGLEAESGLLEQDLLTSNRRIIDLESQLEAAGGQNADLQTELAAEIQQNQLIQQDLLSVQEQLDTRTTEFETVSQQYDDLLTRFETSQQELGAAQDQIATLQGQVETANTQVTTLQGELDSRNAEIAGLENTLSDAQALQSLTAEERDALAAQLETARADAQALQGQLEDVTSSRDSLQEQLSDVQTRLGTAETALTGANEQIATLQGQVETANTQVTTLQGELDSRNAEIAGLENTLSDAQALQSLTAEERDALAAQLETARAVSEQIQSQLADVTSSRDNLQNSLDTALAEIGATREQAATEREQFATERESLLSDLGELQTEYDSFRDTSEADISSLNEQVTTLQSDLEASNQEVARLEQDLADAGGQNTELQAQLDAAISDNQSITSQLNEAQADLQARTETLAEVSLQYDQLLESYGTSQQELGATQERLDISEADLAALRDEYSTYQTETEAEIAALQEQATEYERRVAEYEQDIAERDTQISDLETQLSDVTSQLTTEQGVTAEQSAQIAQLNEQIQTLTTERDALQQEYDAYRNDQESAYSQIQSDLDQRTQELADVSAQYQTIQEQYAAQTEALTLTQQQLEASQADAARTAEERAALEAQMRRGSSIFGPVTGGAEEPPEGAIAPAPGGGAPAEERPTVTPTTTPTAVPPLPGVPPVSVPGGFPGSSSDVSGGGQPAPPTTNVPGTTTQMPAFGTYERPTVQPFTMGTSAGPFQPFALRMPQPYGIQTLQPRLGPQPQAVSPQQAGFAAPPAGTPVAQVQQQYYNPQFNVTTMTPTGGYGMPPNWLLGAPPAIREVTTQGIGQFLGRA